MGEVPNKPEVFDLDMTLPGISIAILIMVAIAAGVTSLMSGAS